MPATEKLLLDILKQEILEKAGMAEKESLVQKDYEYLSYVIEDKTKIRISVSTVKRIYQNKYNRFPVDATLDAFAQYLEYKSWNEFKKTSLDKALESINENNNKKTPGPKVKYNWFLIGIMIIVLFAYFGYRTGKKPVIKHSEPSFSCSVAVTEGVPNSVVFHYNVDSVDADSFFIQQSWDMSRRMRVYKNNYTATDIYYLPGYHSAKLYANDEILKQTSVLISSNGWQTMIIKDDVDKPVYLPELSKGKNSFLYIDENMLTNHDIDVNQDYHVYHILVDDFGETDGNNFHFKTRLKMIESSQLCPGGTIGIICENSMFLIPMTIQGCISQCNVMFGNKYLSGTENDFTSLGFDVFDWNEIEVVNEDRNFKILRNGEEVFNRNYDIDAGRIYGCWFYLEGTVEIKDVSFSSKEQQIYSYSQ